MALSDEEQRLLEQMEAALAADDPKLASALRGTRARKLQRRRAALAGLGIVAGVGALVAGIELNPILSVVGFLVMLVSTIALLTSWQQAGAAGRPTHQHSGPQADSPFIDKLEERWRRLGDDSA